MGRWIDTDDLVSAAQIAERLGVKQGRLIHEWRYRDLGFPDPVADLGQTLVWSWPEVEAWARSTGRL
jgi:hypothetical protein